MWINPKFNAINLDDFIYMRSKQNVSVKVTTWKCHISRLGNANGNVTTINLANQIKTNLHCCKINKNRIPKL